MTTERRHLLGTPFDDFAAWCDTQGLPAFRARQVYEWVFARNVRDFERMTNLAKPLRQTLAEQWTIDTATIAARRESSDGTVKLLLTWPDRATSECVLIPDRERNTACISSQVGCPVGCVFCASGLGGLQRNLTTGEIVEQVIRVRDLCVSESSPEPRLTNLVFMGLGEPLANYANFVAAVRIINAEWGLNIGARRITVSTVGLPTPMKRLADEGLQLNLAISLHAPNDKLRQEIIPWARRIPLDELIEAGKYYFQKTGREITLEYILLGGLNDRTLHAHELANVCHKLRCNVNLLRYNPVPDLPYERPDSGSAHHFAEVLRSRGVNAHIRKSRGLDIDAACGQLRRRAGGTTTQVALPRT